MDYIFNIMAARLLKCRISELHLRSVYLPRRRVIYITNPKVAGSSIIQTLVGLDPDFSSKIKGDHNDINNRLLISSRRDPSRFWRDIHSPEAYRFSFVRNPYSRALSAYLDKIASGREPRFKTYLGMQPDDRVSFEKFLSILLERPNILKINRHWRPQSDLLPREIHLDKIGRFEHFDADFAEVIRDIGGAVDAIPHYAPHATGAGSTPLISERARALVNQIYKSDFCRFGYEMIE